MNGHPSREILALHAGGDLPRKQAAAVTSHLDHCGECRESASELQAFVQRVRNVVPEPSDFDLQIVRSRLSGQSAPPLRTNWLIHGMTVVATIALLVIGVSIAHKEPAPPAANKPLHIANVSPSVQSAVIHQQPVPKRPHIRRAQFHSPQTAGLRAATFLPRSDGSFQLRFSTADPNVVILLTPAAEMDEQP